MATAPNPQASRKYWGCTPRQWAAGFVAVTLVAMLLIPWLGLPWHLIHSDRVEVSGVSFKVPLCYFAIRNSNGSESLLRMGFGFPFRRKRHGFLYLGAWPNGRQVRFERDLFRLRDVVVEEQNKEGFAFEGQRAIGTGMGPAMCFQFKKPGLARARCYIDGVGLDISHGEEPDFIQDVYEVVASARPAQAAQIGSVRNSKLARFRLTHP